MTVPAQLQARFERLERAKSELTGRLGHLSTDVMNRSPAAGGWSVVQVLSHVCLAEDLSVRYIRKKMQAEAPRAGLVSKAKSMLLSLALRSPLKFKAPARSAEVPQCAEPSAVFARWDAVRVEMAQALSEVPPEVVHRAVFRHPRMGMMSLDQALRFMQDHLEHHARQVDRILAKVG